MASFIDLEPNDSFINNEIKLSKSAETSITTESTDSNKDDQIEEGEISSPNDKTDTIASSIFPPPYSIGSEDLRKNLKRELKNHSIPNSEHESRVDQTSHKIEKIQSFEELGISADLLRGLQAFIGKPNATQQAILPDLLINQRRDIFVRLESNSGKKTSYLIAAIERVNHSIKQTQVIIALPLQELVHYTYAYAHELSKFKETTVKLIIRNDELKNPINDQIVISSAGCLLGCIQARAINLSELKCLIVDEVELNLSTDEYVQKIFKLVNHCRAGQLQLYSHSFAHDDRYLNLIRKSITPDPLVFNLNSLECLKAYLHFIVKWPKDDKIKKLITVLNNVNPEKALIYSSGMYTANCIYKRLQTTGFNVIVLTSKSSVEQRLMAIHKFNTSQKIIFITNYPLTQGIELIDLSIVINYDLKWSSLSPGFHYEYYNRISKCSRPNPQSDISYHNLVINLVDFDMKKDRMCVEMLERFFSIKMIEWNPLIPN